jgi:hypothetical protein
LVEAVLFTGRGIKTIELTADDFDEVKAIPRIDYHSQSECLNGLMVSCAKWASTKGYLAALPSCFAQISGEGETSHEAMLLLSPGFAKVGADEADDLMNIPQLFQQVHNRAVELGFVSALPALSGKGNRVWCAAIRPGVAELKSIPLSELRPDRHK